MSTDFRALCAELAGCLDDALTFTVQGDTERSMRQLIARARTTLAQTETPSRLHYCSTHGQQPKNAWGCPECVREMRQQLTQPEPEGVTDRELETTARAAEIQYIEEHGGLTAATPDGIHAQLQAQRLAGLRAVAARYARPAIEPVPVSERLPGPEDCDAEGRCWWFRGDSPIMNAYWDLSKGDSADPVPPTAWLPHHSLPVPTP
jgi:hypothetical protein